MNARIEDKGTHIRAYCSGEWSPEEMTALMMQLKEVATEKGYTKVVKDCFELSAPKTEFHRFQVGEAMAEILPRPFKVLVLLPEELINKFTENTATNRGASVLVCGHEEIGLSWLLGK